MGICIPMIFAKLSPCPKFAIHGTLQCIFKECSFFIIHTCWSSDVIHLQAYYRGRIYGVHWTRCTYIHIHARIPIIGHDLPAKAIIHVLCTPYTFLQGYPGKAWYAYIKHVMIESMTKQISEIKQKQRNFCHRFCSQFCIADKIYRWQFTMKIIANATWQMMVMIKYYEMPFAVHGSSTRIHDTTK